MLKNTINRIKYLIEYDVSQTKTDNILGETDLEYYSVKSANKDKYHIGRTKEKEKKDENVVEYDESVDDLGQDSDSEDSSKIPETNPKTPRLGKKKKITKD